MDNKFLVLILSFLIFSSCGERKSTNSNRSKQVSSSNALDEESVDLSHANISKDSVLSNDQEFISTKMLKGKFKLDLRRYFNKDCIPTKFSKADLIDNFEGYQNIGDIDKDQKDDFVFVLKPLNICEEGESYYFSNPEIPRILSNSYCCHPNSIFSIGDIDEDGRNEIAQYYSSCASRYKSIIVWTLKEHQWESIGKFAYTLNDEFEVFKDFPKLSKKLSKGVFKFLEISDINGEGGLLSEWQTIKMK